MTTKRRNSNFLRKTLKLSDFYRLAQNLANEYASTPPARARTILTEKYNLTESTYYYLLEIAITHHLVSDKVAQQMQEKILANQSAHGNSGYDSTTKFAKALEERKNFSAFSKKDIKYIATYFADHPDIPKDRVAATFSFVETKVLDRVLLRACKELIITDKTFEAIKKRGLGSAVNLTKSQQFFDQLTAYRAEVRRQLRNDGSLF